jgi:hypothetical protein
MSERIRGWLPVLGALSLSAAFFGSLWFGLALPTMGYFRELQDDLLRSSERKARLERMVGALGQAGADPASREIYKGDFLSGDNEAVIVAELQRQLGAIVASNECELTIAQALPVKPQSSHDIVGLRLQVRGALDKVQNILHSIEAARPFLFIERAVFQADPAATIAGASGIAAVKVNVEFDVSAARWGAPSIPALKP